MDLSFSEEQQHIADSADDFLSQACTMASVRRVGESQPGLDAELWRGVAELGWCGVHLPESVDGLGLGLVELVLLQEQLGRRLACVPFFDSVALASTALLACEPNPVAQQWLKRLASGQAMGAMALPDPQSGPLTSPRAEATPSGWLLNGEWTQVGSAAMADGLLLSAHTPSGEPVLLLVPADAPGLVVQPQTPLDATRRAATVRCQGVALSGDHAIAQGAGLDALLPRVRAWGAIALAGEQLGVAQQCLDMTLAYVAQRNQFDRAIASFQAVKHRCAQMLVALESARSAVYSAACEADTSPPAAALLRHAAQARVAATEAAQFCAREALQLHGGVGFTWEYDPHLFLRRAQASSQRLGLGSVAWWLEQVAEQLLDETEEML